MLGEQWQQAAGHLHGMFPDIWKGDGQCLHRSRRSLLK